MKKFVSHALVAALAVMGPLSADKASAEPYIGEIVQLGNNFCPRGWAKTDGQLIAISSNESLFSLIGTIYGGDGRTTFGLPDLRGRIPLQNGAAPGLTNRHIGGKGGEETVTQTVANLPTHKHDIKGGVTAKIQASGAGPDTVAPANAYLGTFPVEKIYLPTGGATTPMADGSVVVTHDLTVGNTGGSQPQNNMQPYLTTTYCIALVGLYPSRN